MYARSALRSVTAVALVAVALLVSAPVAAAHGGGQGAVVKVVQSLPSADVIVSIAPPPGPGPMPLLITGLGDAPTATLAVQLVPRDGGGSGPPPPALSITPNSRHARTTVDVERVGDWDLLIDDGRARAMVPVTLRESSDPPRVWMIRGGIALATLGAIAAVAVRRRPRTALAIGAVALVGLTVSVSLATAGSGAPQLATSTVGGPGAAGSQVGGMSSMPGMDMSGMAMPGMRHGNSSAAPPEPSVTDAAVTMRGAAVAGPLAPGAANRIDLELSDGSTGAPVDDLAIHDQALIHLVVVGPGGFFLHTHPVRVAPGRYTVTANPPVAGTYGLFAEIERESGGIQVARTSLEIEGASGPWTSPSAPGLGSRPVADLTAMATTDTAPIAGRPTTVRLAMTDRAGAPVRDLQPWLGMAGHMMSLGPPRLAAGGRSDDPASSDRVFAHTHDMRAPNPDGMYGPEIAFVHTFPAPGRYQVWIQLQRAWSVQTVPVTLDVGAPAPGA